jgi:hypothetical protein
MIEIIVIANIIITGVLCWMHLEDFEDYWKR